ncbi:MAG: fumarate hydratase [Clostridiaceae bacterium]|nr:fumarate hydratase [Clostridiaceae bacterium]
MIRTIKSNDIVNEISRACIECACNLDKKAYSIYKNNVNVETNENAKYVLSELIYNADIASNENIPLCQDTGMVICFAEIGINVHLEEPLQSSIDKGVRKGFADGCLRKSIVNDPFNRINTLDNTPSALYIDIVDGSQLKINLMLKGFGSENMGFVKMFSPSEDVNEIINYLSDKIISNAVNACPPIFVGIGIGGTMEMAALLSKKVLFRPINQKNKDSFYSAMEQKIKENVNNSNIGPSGYGGKTTVISVAIEKYPTHIAGLPVAVTIQCHALRHKEIII